jgi:hypothetical protein
MTSTSYCHKQWVTRRREGGGSRSATKSNEHALLDNVSIA